MPHFALGNVSCAYQTMASLSMSVTDAMLGSFNQANFLDPAGWNLISPPPSFSVDKLSAYQEAAAASIATATHKISVE
jgi:hypothetical protein